MAAKEGALTVRDDEAGEATIRSAALISRSIDFRDVAGLDAPLNAYTPFAPSVWTGFQEGGFVRHSSGVCEDGLSALFLDMKPGASRWMSLELELDEDGLRASAMAMATICAAATPRIQIKTVLRLPVDGEKPFVDTPPREMMIGPRLGDHAVFLRMPEVNIAPNEACPQPRLLMFMPLRDVTVCLRQLTFGPTA